MNSNPLPGDVVEIRREMSSLRRRLKFLTAVEKSIVRYCGEERDARERQQPQRQTRSSK